MIKIDHLVKKFDGVPVLGPLSMEIKKGRVVGLLGSNGSGKSTLLRAICGIYAPDGGVITIDDGKNVFENNDYKNQLFLVSDDPYYFPQSSILEMAAFYRKMYSRWDEVLFAQLCSIFPLDPKARISTFSKGMKRQAAIILGFSTSPAYLFLDEAFDGLDPVMRSVLKRLIAEGIAKGDLTVVVTSHNINEFDQMCDSITVLHKGQKLLERERDDMNYILKVQVAFSSPPTMEQFAPFEVISADFGGRLATLTIRGERQTVLAELEAMSPLFLDVIPTSLEEVFIYEMGKAGYHADRLI